MSCSLRKTALNAGLPLPLTLALYLMFIGGSPTALRAGELHDAVRAQDGAAIEAILARGADIEETDFIFGTALHVAVSEGRTEIAAILIGHGANLEAVSEQQSSRAMHLAAEFGDVAMLAFLLDRGADIDARDSVERTPLIRAVVAGNTEAVRLLLDREAAVDGRDRMRDRTPLMMASYFGRLEIVKILIDQGADVNATDSYDETSLHFAVGNISYNIAGGPVLIEYLVANGANPSLKRRDGLTPLGYAKARGFKETPGVLRRLGVTE